MTSADIKYSMEAVVGKFHSRGRKVMKLVESVETPDDYTVVFKLKSAVPFFLTAFQPGEAPILPKHILGKKEYAKKKAIRQSPFMKNPVGTGPFRLVEFKEGSHITLERNPYYWKKGRPYLDKIVYRILPDDNSRVIAMEKGEADVATYGNIPAVEVERLKKLDLITATSKGMEAIGPVANFTFNLRDQYIKNLKVRKAINLAIDRKTIANVIWYGQAQPTVTPFFPGSLFYNDKLPGKKEYAKKKAIRQSPFMKNPVGTGPFRLVEFKEGSHITLERNPYYWKKGRPYLDKIVYRILPDDNSRVIAMEKGEADVATYGNIQVSLSSPSPGVLPTTS